jgi:UDP-3-O-[3-hydroxymyristoyl] N-acetylglucosamine deacetylase
LEEAGLKELSAKKRFIKILKDVKVTEGDKFAMIVPSNGCSFEYEISFAHPSIGTQKYNFEFTRQNYKTQIARARTFGFLHEVHYLRSIGLAKGASLQNAIALDESRVLNPEGLRFKDEFVRHKILDAIGDMAFLGAPFIGTYKSFAGSHRLNHILTVAILEDKSAYKVIEL